MPQKLVDMAGQRFDNYIPTADYPARDTARAAYLSWLSRCEANLRDRPTPKVGPSPDKPTAATMRKRLLDQI